MSDSVEIEKTLSSAAPVDKKSMNVIADAEEAAGGASAASAEAAFEKNTEDCALGTRSVRSRRIERCASLCASFLLEVLGGCGAVWGCAELFAVRDGTNALPWRVLAAAVGAWCFARWARVHALARSRDTTDEVLAAFLLEVLGGAGAVWGVLEICGYRVNYPRDCHTQGGVGDAWAPGYGACANTYATSRVLTLVALVWFIMRWKKVELPIVVGRETWSDGPPLGTFVLEVCGGAGAVWGSSEVATLRKGWGDRLYGQPSFDFWRVCCAITFALCFVRWCTQNRWWSRTHRLTGRLPGSSNSTSAE